MLFASLWNDLFLMYCQLMNACYGNFHQKKFESVDAVFSLKENNGGLHTVAAIYQY